jgi:hypothetical protein
MHPELAQHLAEQHLAEQQRSDRNRQARRAVGTAEPRSRAPATAARTSLLAALARRLRARPVFGRHSA